MPLEVEGSPMRIGCLGIILLVLGAFLLFGGLIGGILGLGFGLVGAVIHAVFGTIGAIFRAIFR
jgi:hypothetical protein